MQDLFQGNKETGTYPSRPHPPPPPVHGGEPHILTKSMELDKSEVLWRGLSVLERSE